MVGSVTLSFLHHFIFAMNVKVLVSFTGKNNFVACGAFLQRLTERSDRFEIIKYTECEFPEKLILRNVLLSLVIKE